MTGRGSPASTELQVKADGPYPFFDVLTRTAPSTQTFNRMSDGQRAGPGLFSASNRGDRRWSKQSSPRHGKVMDGRKVIFPGLRT